MGFYWNTLCRTYIPLGVALVCAPLVLTNSGEGNC